MMLNLITFTRVKHVVTPESVDDLKSALLKAKEHKLFISVAGGRHAMVTAACSWRSLIRYELF